MIIPMLAIAGNLAQKKYVPPSLGTFPVTTPLFTLLLISVILILGALDVLSGPEPRSDSRTPSDARRENFLGRPMATQSQVDLGSQNLVRGAAWSSLLKLDPRNMMGNPVMFVVEIGSVITTTLLILHPHEAFRSTCNHFVVVVHRGVRQLRGSYGRGPG